MYIQLIDGVPRHYSITDLRRDNPQVSFPTDPTPEVLAGFDVYPYQTPDEPAYDPSSQVADRGGFELVGDKWQTKWTIRAKTPEELQSDTAALHADVNAERERRLHAGTSFTVAGVQDPIPLTGRPFDQTVYLALLTRAMAYQSAGVTDPILTVRAGDDVIHQLTPEQMISLVSQAMNWFEAVMAASWTMKDNGVPADFTDDGCWP